MLDTNVAVSALRFRAGRLAAFRALWQGGVIVPLLSTATAKELLQVLAYPKFRLTEDECRELLDDYLPYCEVIRPQERPNALAHVPVCRYPDDQQFLDLAQAGDAQALVTGDQDLLALNDPYLRHMCFEIITPAEALNRWSA
ncbi:MAG TPA: putative toxin-antitoxin system toxin component, PIN family [Ramlibacter sp.]|uniref:putative toxin-antitoxin system toxin component, PIN family n=1 Tax=Ramlibacter sp. TaxID=1917967 RepID=UPI002D80930E|nr:putative toxin-antitoxin system toxin component, PIN family [Ramlibacter sp.]HET8747853.1 putative toxin-antitoxin system toxin component, PIN family [Ramlibacter sp.]